MFTGLIFVLIFAWSVIVLACLDDISKSLRELLAIVEKLRPPE